MNKTSLVIKQKQNTVDKQQKKKSKLAILQYVLT